MSTRQVNTADEVDQLTVEVSDPTGQEQVLLEGIRPTATVREVLAMAIADLKLPPNIVWDLRDDETSRLLGPDLPIGEFAAETAPHVRATMQPDAGLA